MSEANQNKLPDTLIKDKVYLLQKKASGNPELINEEVTFISYTSDPVFVVVRMLDGHKRRVLREKVFRLLSDSNPAQS